MSEYPEPQVLRAAFDNLDAGLILTDPSGRISAVNPYAERLLRRRAAAMRDADLHDLLHRRLNGAKIPRGQCSARRVYERQETASAERDGFLRGDGEVLPVNWHAAPVVESGRPLGMVTLFTDVTERRAAEDRQAAELADLSDLTARLTLLGEITAVLSETLEAEEALNRLGRLVVPRLAEWAAVDLITGEGETRRVAVVGPAGRYVGKEGWRGTLPAIPESSGSALVRVLRGAQAALLGPEEIAEAPDSPLAAVQAAFFEALGATSAIVAPLGTARQVVGALTVARTARERPYTPADLPLITDIGRRAGLAIDNARLFEQQRDIAATMQRNLLPTLPDVSPLVLAARYQPAPPGSQVGGDWYDAFRLPDGCPALVIGDVVGHDLAAAAGMAQLRNMLRVLAWDRAGPPGVVVDRLDEAMSAITDVPMATLVLVRVEAADEGRWRIGWANAGHPPPLLVTPEGEAHFLEEGPVLLLGTRIGHEPFARRTETAELPAGSTLLLYTDGLVEAPGSDLATGLERLRRHAAALARHALGDFLDQILARIQPGRADDIALLALRVPIRAQARDGSPGGR
ncbi:SpoIIE family protein phosphatase [Streptomyces hoynatensis]|uniref:protein-serine/threonine phosphatase n=1 Tax=Streptomyces hoynatensis TaxID=1141874 RepID=A0A3A9ZIM3_9ACTN|nr:SpoIIE family protein phosphatase [Streptomyces hoynatensis]RKN47157.1 PAS domain S-box protein [Streptomyces hoynatensis]